VRVLRLAARLWVMILLLQALLFAALAGARLALLPLLSEQPRLLSVDPPDGAAAVSPRAVLSLRFSGPMNPPSVERALRIDPPLPARLSWDARRTTLTISPTAELTPDTAYTVSVDGAALGRLFRPIGSEVVARFRTAPAPAVVAVFPTDGASEVPLAAPLSIRFSRPIVPQEQLRRPAELPELRFEPPLPGTVTWLDQRTALFRPIAPLRPGTRYRATLAPTLTDLSGGRLGAPYSWSFNTPAPRVLVVSPAPGEQTSGPRAPITITVSQPLDLRSVRAGLSFDPATPGDVAAMLLPDGTQLITFTPSVDWQPGVYSATLAGARAAPGGAGQSLVPAVPFSWSFSAPPRPALVGRFPGEGQNLPPGREIRLVFSTPMDSASLQEAVRLSPPAGSLGVVAGGAEVRISADLQAATLYTMTLPADLTDRAGVPLGREYQLRFYTGSAAPALALPELQDHLVYVPPGAAAELAVRRTNLSGLTLALYALDAETVVRALEFRPADWDAFVPERYGQSLLRTWTLPLADPLNAVAESSVTVADTEGGALSPGAYYLRVQTPEGPRADAILLASRSRLALQRAEGTALVWATDVVSAAVRADLPLALYQGGSLVQQGATGEDGLWRATVPPGGAPFVVYADGEQPAVASSAWAPAPAPPRYRLSLVTDRAVYQAGDRIELAGFVRRVVSQTLALPPSDLRVPVVLRPRGATGAVARTALTVLPNGALRGELALSAEVLPGEYELSALLGGVAHTQSLTIHAESPALLFTASPPASGAPPTLVVRTPEGLPVAGALISWTLSVERAPPPELEGYTFGDDELLIAPPAPMTARGSGETGPDGALSIPLDAQLAPEGALPWYRLRATATEPGGHSAAATLLFRGESVPASVGIGLPSRILNAGRGGAVELIAADSEGPRGDVPMRLEVYRRVWETATGAGGAALRARDELVLTRTAVSAADGTARLPLSLPAGEYRLRASAEGSQSVSATSLWVTQPGFTAWGPQQNGRVLLVVDRESYQPGDTATLLLAAPLEESTALVTLARSGDITGTLRQIRAGEPFTLTVEADDAPSLQVGLLTPALEEPSSAGGLAARPQATLLVRSDPPPLNVALVASDSSATPGTTELAIRTTDASGRGVAADVILSLAPDPAVAPWQGGAAGEGAHWDSRLRTADDGLLTVQVALPEEPAALRARVVAATDAAIGQGSLALRVGPPVALGVAAPPFLRAGDSAEVSVEVVSTAATTETLTASLDVTGGALAAGTPATRQETLAPGASARLSWRVEGGSGATVALALRLESSEGPAFERRLELPVLPAGSTATVIGGALGTRSEAVLRAPSAPGDGWGALAVEVVPSRGALLSSSVQAIAELPGRGTLDEAGLLLLSAPLTETRALAVGAAQRLVGMRNQDGGWGWWPGAPSQPFATAAAMEALAEARAAGIPVQDALVAPGLTALQRVARDREARQDLRAYALYALTRHGVTDTAALAVLSAEAEALGPDGLSFLLLARTPGEARAERAVLTRLLALSRRDPAGVYWAAPADSTLPRGEIALTALTVRALEHARSDEELIGEARRWLAARRPVGGWPGGYEEARAATALAPALPEQAPEYAVRLDGAPLLEGGDGGVRVVEAPLAELGPRGTLVLSGTAPVLLSYQLTSSTPPADAPPGDLALLREYLDPSRELPLDPGALVAGQLVRVRLTLVASGPRAFTTLEEPLPAGASLVDLGSGDFEQAVSAGERLLLRSALLTPRIYQHTYLVRLTGPGEYAAPPAQVRQGGGAFLAASNAAALVVTPRR
jgi:alpha-2-macroglobulin